MQTHEESFIFINKDSSKFYYKDKDMTIRHRLDGPAVECVDGYKGWLVDDKLHRLDGPAIEGLNGWKEWFVDGKRHRLDGPAIEYANGTKSWFVNDNRLTEGEFIALTSPNSVELTLDQIASKFGISVKQLKVVK